MLPHHYLVQSVNELEQTVTAAGFAGAKSATGESDTESEPTDGELIAATRSGNTVAFGQLYRRHLEAGLRFANRFGVSAAFAEDAVAVSFERIYTQITAGRGPTVSFRSYLFSAIRANLCNAIRHDSRQELSGTQLDREQPLPDNTSDSLEAIVLSRALGTLPVRWQMILWRVDVEGESPATLAPDLGLSPNAIAALLHRARTGLKAAYLHAHVHETSSPACQRILTRLTAGLVKAISAKDRAEIDLHLAGCSDCRAATSELDELLHINAVPQTLPDTRRRRPHRASPATTTTAIASAIGALAVLVVTLSGAHTDAPPTTVLPWNLTPAVTATPHTTKPTGQITTIPVPPTRIAPQPAPPASQQAPAVTSTSTSTSTSTPTTATTVDPTTAGTAAPRDNRSRSSSRPTSTYPATTEPTTYTDTPTTSDSDTTTSAPVTMYTGT